MGVDAEIFVKNPKLDLYNLVGRWSDGSSRMKLKGEYAPPDSTHQIVFSGRHPYGARHNDIPELASILMACMVHSEAVWCYPDTRDDEETIKPITQNDLLVMITDYLTGKKDVEYVLNGIHCNREDGRRTTNA